MDQFSVNKIAIAHPWVRDDASLILKQCNDALTGRAQVRFLYTLRTEKEQNDLYNLGRTVVNPDGKSAKKPMGNIVTNAKAWQSIHCYGLAIDIVLVVNGKDYKWDTVGDYDGDGVADWMECVKIFKAHGWEWGGDWKSFKDMPHFQFDYGYSWQQLKVLHDSGKNIPGTIYVDLSRTISSPTKFRTTEAVNFRMGPSTSDKVIQVILKGEYLNEISRTGTWSKVEYAGKTGYVSNTYLAK